MILGHKLYKMQTLTKEEEKVMWLVPLEAAIERILEMFRNFIGLKASEKMGEQLHRQLMNEDEPYRWKAVRVSSGLTRKYPTNYYMQVHTLRWYRIFLEFSYMPS